MYSLVLDLVLKQPPSTKYSKVLLSQGLDPFDVQLATNLLYGAMLPLHHTVQSADVDK